MKLSTFLRFAFLALLLSVQACVDDEFDAPPVNGEPPDLSANVTIAELKAQHVLGQFEEISTLDAFKGRGELILRGVITADDASGNFFRRFVIQDETGAIEVLHTLADASVFYPIGREIFIRLDGLWLGDFAGLTQLGGYTFFEDGFTNLGPVFDLNKHFVKSVKKAVPDPLPLAIFELRDEHLSMLIRLSDVEFIEEDVGQPYADVLGRQSLNRTLQDCSGNTIVVRTSGFADFAAELTPEGNGSVVGIFSTFNDTRQLLLRTLDDVQLDGERCGGGPGGNTQRISLAEVRQLYNSGTTSAPADRKVRGIVISDFQNGNTTGRNMVMQDSSAGIVVRFISNHAFALGDEVEVDISGMELSEFNNLLQINGVPNDNATVISTGNAVTPRSTTVAEILANAEAWESTLVELENVTFSGNTIFSGAVTVTDATGSLIMFTRDVASFANEPLPAGASRLRAVLSQFGDDYELILRNLDDLTP